PNENINHRLEPGEPIEEAVLHAIGQIAAPLLVSTLAICVVLIPMFLLTGVAPHLFVPLAEAVIFAMLASYFLSLPNLPTLARFLLARRAAAAASGAGVH